MRLCLLFLSASEAEPLDLGSQAKAWEPVKTRFLGPMRKSYRELPADLRHCAAVISLSSSRISLLEINLWFNL
jgi:RNA:NAD 2'-phosphotransferase (TPT1/KptA family)